MKHDLVCPFENLVDAEVSQDPLDGVVLKVAIAAVHLKGIIDNIEALIGGELLGHGAVHCVVGLSVCYAMCAMSHHKPTGL